MATEIQPSPPATFPSTELDRRLRIELGKIAEESDVLHGDWEPVLDSLRVVSVLLEIEDLFPSMRIPPDKIIRQGGYRSIEDGVAHISSTLMSLWNLHHASRTG